MNVYLYVHNNPINHIDPLGLEDEEQKAKIKSLTDKFVKDNKVVERSQAYKEWLSLDKQRDGFITARDSAGLTAIDKKMDNILAQFGAKSQNSLFTQVTPALQKYLKDIQAVAATGSGKTMKSISASLAAIGDIRMDRDRSGECGHYAPGEGTVTVDLNAVGQLPPEAGVFSTIFHEGEHGRYDQARKAGKMAPPEASKMDENNGASFEEHLAIFLSERSVTREVFDLPGSFDAADVSRIVHGYQKNVQGLSREQSTWPTQLDLKGIGPVSIPSIEELREK